MPLARGEERTFSGEAARAIDAEVKLIVEREHDRARGILVERRVELEEIVRRLLAKETLDERELAEIMHTESAPRHRPTSAEPVPA
jgi:cell division protease FtsH